MFRLATVSNFGRNAITYALVFSKFHCDNPRAVFFLRVTTAALRRNGDAMAEAILPDFVRCAPDRHGKKSM